MADRNGFIKILLILFMMSIIGLISPAKVYAQDEGRKKILILNSYNESDPWEQNIIRKIKEILRDNYANIDYQTENMEMRKYSGDKYFAAMHELYKVKYAGRKYDLIIACDNDAFNLMNGYHDELFSNTPVVFTGVNNLKEYEIKNREMFTGVAEEADIKNTLDIALKLHPEIEEIQVVGDFSTTVKSNNQLIEEIIPYYPVGLKFNFLQSDSIDEIKSMLATANQKSVVFILGTFKDAVGNVIPIQEGTREICEYIKLPAYSCWDFILGNGIIGGVITKADRQGELAGQIAVRVLNGEKPAQIPIVRENMNSYSFDYKSLKANNIKLTQLPENSIIINRPRFPYSFPKERLAEMIMALGLMLLVGLTILTLSLYTRKVSEKALRKKSEHFKKRAEENRKLYTEAIEYDKIKTEFFANISHELRTPLNVLMSSLQLFDMYIKNGDIVYKRPGADKKIYVMRQNCFRLLRLVNNLIDITKIDSGFFDIHLHNKDIVSIVENITLSVAEYIEDKGIDLVFDTDVEEKILACDADKIERIVLNLLSNAIKFTSPGGSIMVAISDKDTFIAVSVKDNGIGIPEEKMKIIFERFRQVDKSLSRNREGSGIGLSLVKSLVELHGGSIYVESEDGKGSEFIFEIPVRLIDDGAEVPDKNIEPEPIERINLEFSDIYS